MPKQVRAARHYQRDDDPVLRLSRSAMRGVARELKHAFNNLSSMVPVDKVAEAIRNGRDPKGLINWHHYREVLRGAFDRLGKLRHAGGALGARKINGAFAARRRKVRFRKAGYTHFVTEGAITGAAKYATTRKASKAEAGYENSSTHGDHCSQCWMFQAVWQCCAVEGVINPNGWCTYWETVFAKAYDPNEPRDERGRWTTGGASDAAKEVATRLNFDPGRIDVSEGDFALPQHTLSSGEMDYAAAVSDLESGRITVYSRHNDGDKIYGNIAHEIGHQKLQSYLSPRSVGESGLKSLAGQLGDPGVSNYSTRYWEAAKAGRTSWANAVHETFAEMSRLQYETGSVPGTPEWQRFYNRVNHVWNADHPLGKSIAKATGDQFNFDSFSPAVQAAARAEQDRLIQQLEADARNTIDAVISAGLADGTSADDMASEISDVIGLTETQWNAVDNYRNMLEELDPDSLVRRLRNPEYDAVVQDSIDAQTDLSEAAIENMVSDYIENYIDYRAATIAQTESTRAANLGLHDAYDQAIERGALTDGAITRFWQLGDNPCPVCESIVDNNPDGVGVNEQFDSIDGPIDDPPVHPNAVFAGSSFIAYGPIQRMVAAEYDGPAVTLYAGNHRTTIGPNHPMFTARGMVQAKFLKVGDKLVYDRRVGHQPLIAAEKSDLDKVPLVEQAFGALDAMFGHARVAASASDLHGDVVFCKNEIHVVFPQRKLLKEFESCGLELFRELGFDGTDVKLSLVSDPRFSAEKVERLLLPAPGGVGGGDAGHFVLLPITKIEDAHFRGWAFDCTNPSSLYCSDGFVVSNCECSVDYVTDLSQVPDDGEDRFGGGPGSFGPGGVDTPYMDDGGGE